MRAAFIIGCAHYDDPDIGSLDFADKDAEDFARVVVQNCGFKQEEIIVLASNQSDRRLWPTKSNIIRALKPRLDKKSKLSTVFFFFSGHGLHSSRDGRDYLVPQDAAANELEDSSIAFEKILEYLKGWRTNSLVLFLDACRAVVQGGKAVTIEEWETVNVKSLHSDGMASLCSCSPYQKSYESHELKNGIFTYGLCEALSDTGKCRTLYELDNYLVKRVPAISREYGKPVQTPYTRVEPVSILHTNVASEQRIAEWRSDVAIGEEVRSHQVASPEPVFGISEDLMCAVDLGTSYSSVALCDQSGKVVLIPSPKGRFMVPSVVSFFSNLDYVVGWEALENAKISPHSTIFSVKRHLGSSHKFNIYGKSLAPEFIASLIVRSLRKNAEEYAQTPISKALIASPANFDIVQTNALVRAFELADLQVFRVIGEPCASTVAFYAGYQEVSELDQSIIVLDLGGGTFDVAVMEVGQGLCETKAVAGDNDLGGIDYDTAVFNYVVAKVQSHIQIPPTYKLSPVDLDQIRVESERVKVALGTSIETSVVLQNLEVDEQGMLSIEIPISQEVFREITSTLNSRIERCILRALKLADWSPDKLNLVFLAGQGSKIFTVREVISKQFPDRPIINKFQETAVIQGLGKYTGVLRGLTTNLLLMDTTYCTIGLKCMKRTVLQVKDGEAPEVEIHISGNEEENTSVGEVLELTTSIPTRKLATCKVVSAKDGKVILKIVEINTFGEVVNKLVGTIDVEAKSGDEFGLEVHVDADRTILLLISNFSTKKIYPYQINNLFHGATGLYRQGRGLPLAAKGFEVLPFRRINESQVGALISESGEVST